MTNDKVEVEYWGFSHGLRVYADSPEEVTKQVEQIDKMFDNTEKVD